MSGICQLTPYIIHLNLRAEMTIFSTLVAPN